MKSVRQSPRVELGGGRILPGHGAEGAVHRAVDRTLGGQHRSEGGDERSEDEDHERDLHEPVDSALFWRGVVPDFVEEQALGLSFHVLFSKKKCFIFKIPQKILSLIF